MSKALASGTIHIEEGKTAYFSERMQDDFLSQTNTRISADV